MRNWLPRLANVRNSLNLATIIISSMVLAVVLYRFAGFVHMRFDMTKQHRYQLSEQTRRVLSRFGTEPIELLAFFDERHPGKISMENLLKEFAYENQHLKYRMIDPDRFPSKAIKYGVDAYGTTVVSAKGRQVHVAMVGEEALTRALNYILTGQTKTIVFVIGHGEPSLSDQTGKGYRHFAMALKKAGYQVKKINLRRKSIPENTDVLILAGPHTDLSDKELKVLRQYFYSGGKLLLVIDPVTPGEGEKTQNFLKDLGVDLGDDVVIDKFSKAVGADFLVPVVTRFSNHFLTRDFDAAVFFPVARSVRKKQETPAGLMVTELAMTGLESWAETDLSNMESGKAAFDEGMDLPGPISLVALIEALDRKGKMVIVGDSDFLNNEHFDMSGNRSFVISIIQSLLNSEINIAASSAGDELRTKPLDLSKREQLLVFLFPVVVLPLLFVGGGIAVFLIRKRHQ